jgi:hypothetical protein
VVTFRAATDREFRGRVVEQSDEVDFAVVLVNVPAGDRVRGSLRALPFRPGSVPVATTVSSIGHAAERWTASVDINKIQGEQLNTITFSNVGILEGFSGGPLFNDENRLIGMVIEVDGVKATALRIDAILRLLALWKVPQELLDRPGCVVQLRSTPPGATVIIGNEKIGTTPMQLPLDDDQKVTVLFEKQGHRREKATVDCKAAGVIAAILLPLPERRLLLFERFDNNRNNWYESYYDPPSRVRDGVFRFTSRPSEWYFSTVPLPLDELQDFRIKCKARKAGGADDYFFGLIWGFSNPDNFFNLAITGDGHLAVSEKSNGVITNFNEVADQNQHVSPFANTLTVEGNGSQLRFFVNDKLVHAMPFRPFHGPGIGFIVYGGVEAEFDDLRVEGVLQQPAGGPQ